MDTAQLIHHPEELGKDTLYELRALVARYPYYQPARLLLLQNLYLLHDPTFDEELRRAAIYITDRKVLFQLVEATHYHIRSDKKEQPKAATKDNDDRTSTLIDNFLKNIPEDIKQEKHRKPTAADATIDYVAYLLEMEDPEQQTETPAMKGQNLIDDFIDTEKGNFKLKDDIEYRPDTEEDTTDSADEDDAFFTETLARIYIKQGRYSKALEIIQRLNLDYPKKNRYFADQIRFLEKLVQNNNKK